MLHHKKLTSLIDPLPLLGLLYPLAVFVKNGKISRDMLVTGAEKSNDAVKEQRVPIQEYLTIE